MSMRRYSAVAETLGFQRLVRRRQPWQQFLLAPASPVALCLQPAVYTHERIVQQQSAPQRQRTKR